MVKENGRINNLPLDELVKQKVTSLTHLRKSKIPSWMAALLLLLYSLILIIALYIWNPVFLLSQTGLPNGGYMFTHFQESVRVKEMLENVTFDFWFSSSSLGYPMLMSHPLPTFFTGICMIIFEPIASAESIFRWIIVLLVSLIPVTTYRGSRLLFLSRTHSLLTASLILAINSHLQFGFELSAFLVQGMYQQLFALVLLPLIIGNIYSYYIRLGQQDVSSPVYLLSLVYLSHSMVGLYCSAIALLTALFYSLAQKFGKKRTMNSIKSVLQVHLKLIFYLSWLLIPGLISYPYLASRSSVSSTINCNMKSFLFNLTSGRLFDYERSYPCLTFLAVLGFVLSLHSIYKSRQKKLVYWNSENLCAFWLLLVTIISFITIWCSKKIVNFLSIFVVVQADLELGSYLFTLHYVGALFAAIPVIKIIEIVRQLKVNKNIHYIIQVFIIVSVVAFMVKSTSESMVRKVVLVEASDDFHTALKTMKTNLKDGRILVHEKLGSGEAWDLVNIPYYTGKPGVFRYSNSPTNSLSLFYLDAITENNISSQKLRNLLRLYNICYVAVSSAYMQSHLVDLTGFKHIFTVNDIHFYEVHGNKNRYGYFDVIRIPGYIDGDLQNLGKTILDTLHIYDNKILFALNPRRGSNVRNGSSLNVQVIGVPIKTSSENDISIASWKFNKRDINSQDALGIINEAYGNLPFHSTIIEEKRFTDEYHAILSVYDQPKQSEMLEHVLLKVTYHPFWRCKYFKVDEDYTLQQFNSSRIPRGSHSATINHVTPNLMSVTLPAGRYHVIFRYRIPGVLKILALISIILFLKSYLRYDISKSVEQLTTYGKNYVLKLSEFVLMTLACANVSIYYSYSDSDVTERLKIVCSYFSTPVLSLQTKVKESINSLDTLVPVKSILTLCHSRLDVESLSHSLSGRFSFPSHSIGMPVTKEKYDLNFDCLENHNSVGIYKNNNDQCAISNEACEEQPIDHRKCPDQEHPQDQNPFRYDDDDDDADCLGTPYSLDKSFDFDTFYDNGEIIVSPPTPPKHLKKSYRKKHARLFKTEDSACDTPEKKDFEFKNRTSPVLNNILTSLRKNSLSPTKDTPAEFDKELKNRYINRRRKTYPLDKKLEKNYPIDQSKREICEKWFHASPLAHSSICDTPDQFHENSENDPVFNDPQMDIKYAKKNLSFEETSISNRKMALILNTSFDSSEDPPMIIESFGADQACKCENIDRMISPRNDVLEEDFSPDRSSSPDLSHCVDSTYSAQNRSNVDCSLNHEELTKSDDHQLSLRENSDGWANKQFVMPTFPEEDEQVLNWINRRKTITGYHLNNN